MSERDRTSMQGSGTTDSSLGQLWAVEEVYWSEHWHARPYASTDRDFEYYRPGYQYGFEAANRHRGRTWDDVESDLRTGWDRYEHRGKRTWEQVKDAVRDAWNRVTHH